MILTVVLGRPIRMARKPIRKVINNVCFAELRLLDERHRTGSCCRNGSSGRLLQQERIPHRRVHRNRDDDHRSHHDESVAEDPRDLRQHPKRGLRLTRHHRGSHEAIRRNLDPAGSCRRHFWRPSGICQVRDGQEAVRSSSSSKSRGTLAASPFYDRPPLHWSGGCFVLGYFTTILTSLLGT